MSDSGEIEVEAVSTFKVLPKDITDEIGTIKLLYVARRCPHTLLPLAVRGPHLTLG